MSAVTKRSFPKPIEQEQPQTQTIQQNNLQHKRSALLRRLSLLGGLFCLTAILFAVVHIQSRGTLGAKQEEQQRLEKQVTELKAEQAELTRQVTLLNDEEYVTKLARNKYHFSKDGEIIFPVGNEN